MLTLDDETDNFCSASQMRKSHSIDTSYLYEEATSTFAEAVNPKINSNQGNMTTDNIRNNSAATNLCKSKSEYNLAFASPTRSGKLFNQFAKHKDFSCCFDLINQFWDGEEKKTEIGVLFACYCRQRH